MNDREALLDRLDRLERALAEAVARNEELQARNAELQTRNEELQARVEELQARVEELEQELRRRGKNYRPKANAKPSSKAKVDRRRKPHRQHPGTTRDKVVETAEAADIVHHDVHVEQCPLCGGGVEPTGEFSDVLVEDIPPPKIEVHRYRRHVYRCPCCETTVHGRPDLDVPGGTVGDRLKLLTVYCRAHLGVSLGKTTALMNELFGVEFSRAGALGHLRWFLTQFDPVVQELLKLLRESSVVQADETGWRINGKNVWCWLFANPNIAVYLIDHRRSRAVIEQALGTSLPGVLVTDFYAAYNRIACRKQRCIVHLLRELAKLREELPATFVTKNIQPLMELFQDAIKLSHERERLSPAEFDIQASAIRQRFNERWWRQSTDPDCQRIYNRLRRHKNELLTFLDVPGVPADNNGAERDIRSVAAARSDGGVNRTDWGAKAFATAKSIVRTCQKVGRNFFGYALAALEKIRAGQPPPLPLAAD